MGLPGSGKTTLANELGSMLNAKRLNADEVRKEANDWDFSEEGRTRQAKRMSEAALKIKSDAKYMFLVSVKDIKVGEELTANYNLYTYPKTGVGIQMF